MSLTNGKFETDKEGNLFLNHSPQSIESLKQLLDDILLERSDLKIMEPAYYENLVIQWRDKLLRYPLAVKENEPFLNFFGFDFSLPLIFLNELKERFNEIKMACLTRQLDNDLPLITHFVTRDAVLLSFAVSEIQPDEVLRRLEFDPRSISRAKEDGVYEFKARLCGYLVYGDKGMEIIPAIINEKGPYFITMRILPVITGISDLVDYGNEYVDKHKGRYPNAPVRKELLTEENIRGNGLFSYGEVDLVTGVEPRQGKDCRVFFPDDDEEGQDEMVLSVDYHEISQIKTVSEGELIAVRELVVPGNDGLDIFGKSIPVKKGQDMYLRIDGNIRVERLENEFRYIAMISGVVNYQDNCLSLKETLIIKGDVNYFSGNIDFEKSVHIQGNVVSGFSVNCGGSLLIEGLVEDNVKIASEGLIKVNKGIIGGKTLVSGESDIICGFIERAHVKCLGNLTVERSVLGGTLDILGNLTVQGRGLSQKNIGVMSGVLCRCYRNIHVLSLGAEANKTQVYMGYNFQIDDKMAEVNEAINGHRVRISQFMDSLPFDLSTPFAREKLKNSGKKTREEVKMILMKIKYTNEEIGKLEKSLDSLADSRYEDRTDSFSLHSEEGIRGKTELFYKDGHRFVQPKGGPVDITFSPFDKIFIIT